MRASSDPKIGRRIGLLFATIGLGLLTGCLFAYRSQDRFYGGALSAEGTVVDLEWSRGSARSVVTFRADDELEYTVKGSVWSKPPAHEKGEKVKVVYHAGRPQEARLASFFERWFLVLVFGFMGAIFTGVGTLVALALGRGR
jgi:hypothetical protein